MGIKKADHAKSHGVVYTPEWLADAVLGLIPEELWLDDGFAADFSCGDGVFLEKLCQRAQAIFSAHGKSMSVLHRWCQDKLWGADIDSLALEQAKKRLDSWAQSHGLEPVRWQLSTMDLLSQGLLDALEGRCSIVAGNPPYVRIQNLSPSARSAVRKLSFCAKGSTDLYLACYELGLKCLRPHGALSFVAPNSWIRAKAGADMRQALGSKGLARDIVDFGAKAPFDGVGTYCAIACLGKTNEPEFGYAKWDAARCRIGPRAMMQSAAWLSSPPLAAVPTHGGRAKAKAGASGKKPLGSLCKLGVGFATLADGIFISDESAIEVNSTLGLCAFKKEGQTHWIETCVARPLVKASTSKPPKGKPTRWIIYPYAKGPTGRVALMAEKDLAAMAPNAYAYLLERKIALLGRDKGKIKKESWHGYGRSQGLSSSFEAWAAAPALSKSPLFFEMPKTCKGFPVAFISGLGVGFDAPESSRIKLMAKLNSAAMAKHMVGAGADYSGGYKAYSKSAVESLMVAPIEVGVNWFASVKEFLAWAKSPKGAKASEKTHKAAKSGASCVSVWRTGKKDLRDALRSDFEKASPEAWAAMEFEKKPKKGVA